MAQRIVKYFDFRVPIEYDKFIEQIEVMLNQNENLFKMCFDILDFDEDGLVTELDLYAAFKIYEYQDDIFIKAFS